MHHLAVYYNACRNHFLSPRCWGVPGGGVDPLYITLAVWRRAFWQVLALRSRLYHLEPPFLLVLGITLREYLVFRRGGGALVAFAAEARALHGGGGALPAPACLFSSRSRASMSRSVRIKCQHGDRDRDSRQPECLQTHRMDPKFDNFREHD